jgi:phage/plasmid-like protein (TIGR03299 family)
MAHEVETIHYVKNERLAKTGTPWHGLGEAHDGWLTDEEAKKALDWQVELRPDFWRNDEGIFVHGHDSQKVVKIVNGRAVKEIATVGNKYVPFQNDDLIELGSVLVDDWGAKWDTVASLRNDRLVFATLRLDVVSEAGRGLAELDDSDWFSWFLLSDAKDGSSGLEGDIVNVRTVCANTFKLGKARAKAGWKIRHTGDLVAKAKEAHRLIGLATQAQADFVETAQKLAESKLAVEEFDELGEFLFPSEKKPERTAKKAKENQAQMKGSWLRSETIPESLRFTGWGALNGVTEWAEHSKAPRQDSRVPKAERRMLSTVFGGPVAEVRDRATGWLTTRAAA